MDLPKLQARRFSYISALLFILIATGSPAPAQVSGGKLPTGWDKDVSPTNPLPEYPRPQMVRAKWQSLNGRWDYAVTDVKATAAPTSYDGKILVPYPYESALSGIGKPSIPDQRLWYRRAFTLPASWRGKRVLLHFGAVNWNSTVIVNDTTLGQHIGGYDAFDYDITAAIKPGENQLIVSVQNPLIHDTTEPQILGKQRPDPGGIMYTGATGIWQSVWLEPVPETDIIGLKITPDVDASALHLTVHTRGDVEGKLAVTLLDGKRILSTTQGDSTAELTIPIVKPRVWSPLDPYLYGLRVAFAKSGSPMDVVESYAALRKISLGKDEQGRTRILLNNQFVFEVGALDQGYWPDGIYTAPTDDALKSDIEAAKKLGFNLLRKHAKVEPERWYTWADKIGMLVWQDMPQAFGTDLTDAAKEQWLTEMNRMISSHDDHPSIIVWTLFNEAWGQHDTEAITKRARQLDPTRLVNSASGGYNQLVDGKMSQFRLPTPAGLGDINDTHSYPDPSTEKVDDSRALVCGEFGGVSFRVPGHLWTDANVGYGHVMNDGWHLTQRYQQLLKEADRLRTNLGASAVIYTQITDVEGETNGLLTYDRALVKPLADIILAANQGQFPALPPAPPSHDLMPTSEDQPQTWSYVTARPANNWAKPGFDDTQWKTGPAPFGQGYAVNTPWTDTPGDIWLRRTVTLPAIIPAKLSIVTKHDEDVEVYVNGVECAAARGVSDDYASLPMDETARATLTSGASNLIAVHCRQRTGGQVIDVGIREAP